MYLLKFDILRYTWNTLTYFGHLAHNSSSPTDVFGALYGSPTGYIYGSENNAGDIWTFPVAGYPGIASNNVSSTYVQGPTSGIGNDGARCYYANLNGTIQTSAYPPAPLGP